MEFILNSPGIPVKIITGIHGHIDGLEDLAGGKNTVLI